MKRLAIVCSHPVQYYAPVFQRLSKALYICVFYTAVRSQYDKGFQREVNWDTPLLEGYDYRYSSNIKDIEGFRPDYILIYGWAYLSHIRMIRYFSRRVPVLFRGDSVALTSRNWLHRLLRKALLSWVYSYVTKAFYVGTRNKAYFLQFGLTEDRLAFAPHAVDNDMFAKPCQHAEVRCRLKLTDTDILVLYAGKFIWQKNVALLVDALLAMRQQNVHLLLVGSGKLQEKLSEKASTYGNIHFLGFQNQSAMPSIYQAADLVCLPSKQETWGLVLNEAMAAGKAVLASDAVGAAADLIASGNGAIFKSNDLADLTDKLRMLISSKEDLKEMGRSSQSIIANWTFDIQVKNIVDGLNSL